MPANRETEGEIIQGWPDRKRVVLNARRDAQGRVDLARTPYWDLQGMNTPTDLRYIVKQFDTVEPVHPDDWSLSVGGLVGKSLRLSFEDIRGFPARTVRCLTECSGNETELWDYAGKGPKPDRYDVAGVYSGLASAGEWVGTPLGEVLKEAGMKPGATAVRAEGFDRGTPPQEAASGASMVVQYDKCLPLDKALDKDTILAWALNGEYIRHLHGAPLRLIVPGWSGHWSVKWLQRLEVLDHMAHCYFQDDYYYFARSAEDPARRLVTAMGVKSMITQPRDSDSPLQVGRHVVRGMAWSGSGAITRVELSVDCGETWHDAHVEEPRERWLWARWSYAWQALKAGRYRILARATDEAGRRQPQTEQNQLKLNYDGLFPVDIDVE